MYGELAALGTAVFWAISSLLFTIGGRRVGADVVNIIRLYFCLLFIVVVQIATSGFAFDTNVESWRHGVLFLSAFIGLVIGDGALFYAFVSIGPRLSMLVMSLVPVFCALFARICFGELLTAFEWGAILFSIAAISYVVAEDRTSESHTGKNNRYLRGILLAGIGALGQTGNLIITKYALADNFSTLTATEIRIFYSLLILTGWAIYQGNLKSVFVRMLGDRIAIMAIAGGALVGPFIGIWLSYIAINETRVAVASIIMATPPLFLIPLAAYYLKEKITWRSILGTVLAFGGIALLLLSETIFPVADR